ncbi:acyl-CoA dehydrogenase family protein [Streptomyces sp. 142MFCol3.1]|uniref:acyl-CoA dehydrogenase family protein n=1 Tax=Streptomyces sp. 142MFCol3.1 TaxID=1172179 RepID=UPI000420F2E1|nr:acyl-CoA dehydrogenase family protein [Streptomyces sp. 142MFCol3.1]
MHVTSRDDNPDDMFTSRTDTDLVARAKGLQPLLRRRAAQGESDRAVTEEVVEAMAQAGVFRLLTPRRYGGHQTDLRTLTEVSEALGTADGSTAWVGMIISVTNCSPACSPTRLRRRSSELIPTRA